MRKQVMENGTKIDGPFFTSSRKQGKELAFNYVITNLDDGHNFPSGSLGAQPEIWFNVAVSILMGRIFGSRVMWTVMATLLICSLDLAAGKIEHDDQLFNLQTKFLTTNVRNGS